jgi:hypothetical protein
MPQKEEKVTQGVDRSTPDLRGGIFSFPPFPNNNHPGFLRGCVLFCGVRGKGSNIALRKQERCCDPKSIELTIARQ